MNTLITLYKYDRRLCSCQEEVIIIRYDSARTVARIDESLWGRIKRLFA
jgi:hypothetical protein